MQLLRSPVYRIGMVTASISAGSFEKVFLQSAAGAMGLQRDVPTDGSLLEKRYQDLADWRVIA
jgi:hypothetical protein